MNNRIKVPIYLLVSLLVLSLCSSSCRTKPETCHKSVKIANNSDSTVSICRFGWFSAEICTLDKIAEIRPKDTAEISMELRWCLEEMLLSDLPSVNYTLCVLPETYSYVHTTLDSLEIAYDVLKKIDLMELGPDSLLKTNYTVYYP